jgi:hypothetical protein
MTRISNSCVPVALLAMVLVSAPRAAMAQAGGAAKADAAAIPRTPDGKPDLTGVWQRPYVPDMTRNAKDQVGAGALPYTEEGAAIFKAYDPAKFDYTGRCLPQGLTRSMNSPFPMEIFQSPGKVAFLYEAWNVFHIVPIGRQHPKDPDDTWMGNSVARWEGDTLVVDTITFNDKTNLDTVGHPHSDQMHVVERFSRTDATHIGYEVTVEDPKIFTKAWKNTRVFTLRPDWEIMEYSCEENNKDFNEGHIK